MSLKIAASNKQYPFPVPVLFKLVHNIAYILYYILYWYYIIFYLISLKH